MGTACLSLAAASSNSCENVGIWLLQEHFFLDAAHVSRCLNLVRCHRSCEESKGFSATCTNFVTFWCCNPNFSPHFFGPHLLPAVLSKITSYSLARPGLLKKVWSQVEDAQNTTGHFWRFDDFWLWFNARNGWITFPKTSAQASISSLPGRRFFGF